MPIKLTYTEEMKVSDSFDTDGEGEDAIDLFNEQQKKLLENLLYEAKALGFTGHIDSYMLGEAYLDMVLYDSEADYRAVADDYKDVDEVAVGTYYLFRTLLSALEECIKVHRSRRPSSRVLPKTPPFLPDI